MCDCDRFIFSYFAVATEELLALDGFADGEEARGALAGTTHTAIAREARFSAFGSYSFVSRPR